MICEHLELTILPIKFIPQGAVVTVEKEVQRKCQTLEKFVIANLK